jgi:hypothetical protein
MNRVELSKNTSDGTQINVTDLAVASNKTFFVQIMALAVRDSGETSVMYKHGMFFCDVNGNMSARCQSRLENTFPSVMSNQVAAVYDIRCDLSNLNNVGVNIRGAGGHNLYWSIAIETLEYSYLPPP